MGVVFHLCGVLGVTMNQFYGIERGLSVCLAMVKG